MNTKKLFQNIKYVALGSMVAVGLSYVAHAATFANPTSTPPANNTPFPLNVGTTDQVKQGGLSVTTFIANANAELDGKTYFTGVIHADPGIASKTINFGGTDPNGIARKVSLAISGAFSNSGSITSTPLSNSTTSTVCADANGKVVLCSVTTVCSNIPGSTTVPPGDVKNGDGTCSVAPKRFYSSTVSGNKFVENFTSSVVNSKEVYHVSVPKGTTAGGLPLVGTLGLDNDFPKGWKVDTIDTISGTSLDSSHSRVMTVTEKGSYLMKISSQGKVGIKGKFADDQNWLGVDFFMKVHTNGADQWFNLYNGTPVTGPEVIPHEAYPVPNRMTSDFVAWVDGNENTTINFPGMQWGGSGDAYSYIPYNLDFQKTMSLAPGDTVDVLVYIYGLSTTGDTSAIGAIGNATQGTFHNSPNNFTYSFESPNTIFDFTETPQ